MSLGKCFIKLCSVICMFLGPHCGQITKQFGHPQAVVPNNTTIYVRTVRTAYIWPLFFGIFAPNIDIVNPFDIFCSP